MTLFINQKMIFKQYVGLVFVISMGNECIYVIN